MSQTHKYFKDKTIESVSSYWNNRPCNIRHSAKPTGSREYFDEVEERKYLVEPHIPLFAEFDRWKGKHVLEIGCGIGTDTMNFARAGAYVTAVDLSIESIKIAQRRANIYGLNDRINFYQANAEHLSDYVPLNKYDLVYSFGVIHHTPNPENVIKEIQKYMGPESILKIMVYNRYSWKVLWIIFKYGKGAFWNLDKLVARYSEAESGCPVTYSYSKKTIKKLLTGFIINKTFFDHIFPYSITEYKNYKYIKVWYFRWCPSIIFKLLEKIAGWHLCVEASLNKNI